jgi:hypothetical protein
VAGLSNVVEQYVLKWMFKRTAFPAAPTTLWFSLHSADPADTGGSELTGNNYGRGQLDPDPDASTNAAYTAITTSGTNSRIQNVGVINFPQAQTGNWNGGSAILYWGLWDASSNGTFLIGGSISPSGVVVLQGNTLSIAANQLTIDID